MNSRIFPSEYYEICSSNSNRRMTRWFCNKPLSPIPPVREEPESNILLQDKLITSSSDESLVKDISIVQPSEQLIELEDETIYENSGDEYIPSSSSDESSESSGSPEIPLEHDPSTRQEPHETSNNPKRIRKRDFCYFCESFVLNFARHVFRIHNLETEVQKIFVLPAGSKMRKQLLTSLRKKGNFLNDSDQGKPVRQGNKYITHVPCRYCYGFYSTKNLWRHRNQCSKNPQQTFCSAVAEAQNFSLRNIKIDPELREKIFPHMRGDQISLTAKKDTLICAFASRYIKIHREKHFISVASRKMRELSRLLLEMQKLNPSIRNLFDCLKPQNFDLLVAATKNITKYNKEKEIFGSPSLAMNMGTALKQCCEIALIYALKRKDIYATISAAEAEAELKTLIQLLEAHWKYEISSQASNDLNINRWNKVTLVPLATDLKLLKEYLIKTANISVSALEKNSTNERAYTQLLETIFCRVILLNRKRPGELQRLPLHICETSLKSNGTQTYQEFCEVISETERALMSSFKRVVIRGKRGRGVPVLFSEDVQEHLKILLKYRNGIIKKPNIYLFGHPSTSQPIVGYKILKKYAMECGAQNPAAITCTKLRKHLATLTQLLNMSENDMEQLAAFMGHTLNIHKSSYRLPDDVYQTARLSKLLLLMEKGEAAQFRGKSLDEINVDLEEDLMENLEDNLEERIEEERIELENSENEGKVDNNGGDSQDEINNPETKAVESRNKQVGKAKNNKKRVLVPWKPEQKEIVELYFKNHIKSKKPAKKSECEALKQLHPKLLENKDWLKIKVYVQNKYSKK